MVTPPSVPKVCRECLLFARYNNPQKVGRLPYCDASRQCAALELLRKIVAGGEPMEDACNEECEIVERLREEVE